MPGQSGSARCGASQESSIAMQVLVTGTAGFIGFHVALAWMEEGVANFVARYRDYYAPAGE